MNHICKEENVKISEEALKILCGACEGDLRKAITYLQTAAKFCQKSEICVEEISEISGIVPQNFIDEFLFTCRGGQYEKVEIFVKVKPKIFLFFSFSAFFKFEKKKFLIGSKSLKILIKKLVKNQKAGAAPLPLPPFSSPPPFPP